MSSVPDFEQMHLEEDPFGYRSRWYEQRKRDLLLAVLPHPRYARAWEPGCSNGVLTAALARRCDALLATDLSARAVAHAQQAVRSQRHVEVRQARHPGDWPAQVFDLVVCSEMGYYLPPDELPALATGLQAALAPDGLLLGCHWRVPFDAARSRAGQVHAALGSGLVEVFHYDDVDFVLQGWARAPLSVASWEGLR